MKNLVLIDSNAIIHRAYHALPKDLANTKGELTNVTYGFALALIKILEEIKPDYLAAAFDLAGPTFRHLEYKEYKATRVRADQELYDQIPRVKEMLKAFGIPIYALEGFEADDVLGTIVAQIQISNLKSQNDNPKCKIYIASGDKDVFQLLNGNVAVLLLRKGFNEAEIFDHNHLKEKYNLDPEDFIDLKALMGDASDNIPGIPGIGPKTATDLIIRFDTLSNIYEQIAKLLNCSIAEITIQQFNNITIEKIAHEMDIKERIVKLLIDNKDQAFQSQRLATIRRDVPIKFDLAKARWGQYDRERVRKLFEELEFKSLLRRFSKDHEEAEDKTAGDERPKAEGKKITEEQKKKDEQLKLEL